MVAVEKAVELKVDRVGQDAERRARVALLAELDEAAEQEAASLGSQVAQLNILFDTLTTERQKLEGQLAEVREENSELTSLNFKLTEA